MKYVAAAVSSVILLAGCQQNPPQRLNSPPQGQNTNPSPMQKPFSAMVYNATLTDMSVADVDFAGTSAELSGTGQAKMERMVKIVKTYGGEVRYATTETDQKLIQSRINRLQDYLASAGVDMDKVTVRSGMQAFAGMSAAEAVEALKAPTAKDDSKGSALPKIGSSNGGGTK